MKENLLTGDVLGEQYELSLRDLSVACSLESERIVEFVDEGILKPIGRAQSSWRFSTVTILTVRKAERLQRDLGLNLAGVAMVLELLEEIGRLQSRIELLDRP